MAASDPGYDPFKRELAAGVAHERQPLFDLFAPPGGSVPDREAVEALLEPMVDTIRRVDPLMDPAQRLAGVRVPVRLVHGRGDVLIPFTETLRTAERMGPDANARVTITRLFTHSQEDGIPGGVRGVAESARFVRALGGVLRMV